MDCFEVTCTISLAPLRAKIEREQIPGSHERSLVVGAVTKQVCCTNGPYLPATRVAQLLASGTTPLLRRIDCQPPSQPAGCMHVCLVERHGTTGDVEVDRKVKGWLVGKALLGESRHPRPHTNDSTAQDEEKEDVDGAEKCKHPILHFYDGASLLAASPLPICTRREY